jgi:hypothetical protein
MHRMETSRGKTRRLKPSGKLKTALDLMVWGDETGAPAEWDQAARNAKITVRAMRKALEKPHVRAYLREQKEVLRDALSAKTFYRLAALRDQDENKNAAVSAAKALEQIGDDPAASGDRSQSPGLVIMVVGGPVPSASEAPQVMRTEPHRPQSLGPPTIDHVGRLVGRELAPPESLD